MLITRITLGLIICIHVIIYIFNVNIIHLTLSPERVIYLFQFYRIISSALLHGGLMHLFFNSMSYHYLGKNLENRLGTMRFFLVQLILLELTGLIHITISYMLTSILSNNDYIKQQSIGYSGIIFGLITIESYSENTSPMRVFYGAQVPAKVYPFFLLLVFQIVLPNISFVGHLSGIVSGIITLKFMKSLIPSEDYLKTIEDWNYFHYIKTLPTYKLLDYATTTATASSNV